VLAPLGWLTLKVEVVAMTAVAAVLVGGFAIVMQSGLLTSEESTPTPVAGVPTITPETPSPGVTSTPPSQQALFPRLTVGPPIELPEDISLYVWSGCTSCDTPSIALRRFERSGTTVEERSLFGRTINAPYIFSGWVENDVVYIAECTIGYCGGVGERSSDATITLYRSVDRGTTWESMGAQSVPAGLLIADPIPANWGIASSRPVAQQTVQDGVWEVNGVELDLRALDPRGVPPEPGTPAYYAWNVDVDATGRITLQWAVHVRPQSIFYLSVFDATGKPLVTYESSAGGVWLDADRLIGTVVYDPDGLYQSPDIEYGWIPSIIDLRDGSVHPILDPFGSDPSNRNTVVGVQRR
jgi:hypothetical protein